MTLSGGTNQGNVGGAVFFDLTVASPITLTQIDCSCGANMATGTGTIGLYLGPTTYLGSETNPGAWTLASSSFVAAVAPGATAPFILAAPVALAPGTYGIAVRANGFAHGYTNGVACTSSVVPGSCANSLFFRSEVALSAGAAQHSPFTSSAFSPRVFNGAIHWLAGQTCGFGAACQFPFGAACPRLYHSFFEWFTFATDLGTTSGTRAMRLQFIGTGYRIGPLQTGTAFFAPTPSATNLNLGNDATATVPLPFPLPYPTASGTQATTVLEVCSNGFVSPAASNGVSPLPTITALLAGEPRWCHWHDFDPSLGGTVTADFEPNGTAAYVTWSGVADAGAPGSTSTWQLRFDIGGDVEFRWQTMHHAAGAVRPTLVGYSPGRGALDPGSADLSALTILTTGPIDRDPLALRLDARPVLGTNPNLRIDGHTPATTLGIVVFGFASLTPGVPLDPFGMPACFQHVQADLVQFLAMQPTSTTRPFLAGGIPNVSSLAGVSLFVQAATFTTGFNAAGVITSNGLNAVLGF